MFKEFSEKGAHFLVDGQFGSTGKGLLAAWIERKYGDNFTMNVTNAGPNSGHTSYAEDGTKVVLKQLPTLSVLSQLNEGCAIPIFISAGAVIDLDILSGEIAKYLQDDTDVIIHPQAAVITEADIQAELEGSIASVAGTRKGVGAALIRKIARDPSAVFAAQNVPLRDHVVVEGGAPDWSEETAFVEVSQGFSLGINSGFYPKVTSRECTVMQAAADARIPCQLVRDVAMCVRTFPIRVGNVDGHSSGDWYIDQEETTWEALGVEPERTTVTNRIRRVATFSFDQFRAALAANRPTLILVNFLNYIPNIEDRVEFGIKIVMVAQDELGYLPKFLWGYGPKVEDISEVVI